MWLCARGGLLVTTHHPLAAVAYERWKHMPWEDVLREMAVLFHLAVQIEAVKALDAPKPRIERSRPAEYLATDIVGTTCSP